MKVLLIGGTGNISTSVTRQCVEAGFETVLLNRGRAKVEVPEAVRFLYADINDEAAAAKALEGETFDAVIDFIAFEPWQVQRDVRLFREKTAQYVFISSCAIYQKPPAHYRFTESAPQYNPGWKYACDKIACEQALMDEYRASGFPITIVRPSHTYAHQLPLALQGAGGSYQTMKRMLEGKPVFLHGDGTSLWTFTHSDDVAQGILGLLGNIHAIGEAVHITSDEAITWNQGYECIGAALGVKPVIRHLSTELIYRHYPQYREQLTGDMMHSVSFDNSKLKRLVPGYCAKIRFDQGCRWTVRYILSHPELMKEDPEFDRICDHLEEIWQKI